MPSIFGHRFPLWGSFLRVTAGTDSVS